MSAVEFTGRKLDIGRVFRDTFGVIRRQARLLVGVTFVLSFLPSVANQLVAYNLRKASVSNPLALMSSPDYWVIVVAAFLLGACALTCQLFIAVADLEGRRAELKDVMTVAGRKTLPVILALILVSMGAGLGSLLFVVPGIILMLMWSAAIPALVVEGGGVFAALRRSRALTRGNRWRILGLVIVVFVLILLVEGVILVPLGVLTRGGAGASLPVLLVAAAFSFAISLAMSVGSAALYVQLREIKGGGESVAQVFA